MRFISLLLLSLFPFLAVGQTEPEDIQDPYLIPTTFTEKTYPNHQFGMAVSPDVSYRILLENKPTTWGIIEDRNQHESSIVGLTAGLSYIYNFNRFWGLETGVYYSLKGYQRIENDLFTYDDYDPNVDIFVNTKTARFSYQFHYIDVPVKANFTIGTGRVKFVSSLGVVGGLLVTPRQVTRINYEDGGKHVSSSIPDIKPDFNRFSIAAMVSVGMDFRFTDQINIKIEPVGRVAITPVVNSSYSISERLYNIGLNVGVYWTL